MVSLLAICLALALGVLIVATEVLRRQPPVGVDARRVTAVLYFICFVIVPLWLQVVDLRFTRDSAWRWVLQRSPVEGLAPYACAIALLCYCFMLVGFHLGRPRGPGLDLFPPDRAAQRSAAFGLLVIGAVALVGYTSTIGGIVPLIFNALAFRSSEPPVVSSWAFLRSIMPLVLGASFIYYGLRRTLTGPARRAATAGLTVSVLLSLVVLFHQAGRLSLLLYVLVFPLAASIIANRLRWQVVALGAAIVLPLAVLGKSFFSVGSGSADRLARLGEDILGVGNRLLLEFSFPMITLSNAVADVPQHLPFRFFADFPLAFLYLVPQRLLGIRHPETISMLNTHLFDSTGTVPVDVVSFGYMSLWLPGVMVVGVLYGFVVARSERWVPSTREPVGAVMRAAWMLFLARTVMYGDPQLVVQACFGMLVTSGALVMVPRLRGLLRRAAVEHG